MCAFLYKNKCIKNKYFQLISVALHKQINVTTFGTVTHTLHKFKSLDNLDTAPHISTHIDHSILDPRR